MNSITAQDLRSKLSAGEDIQVIDIREEHEVLEVNMGGIHIPMGEILERREELRKDVPVVIHCRSGKRSAAVISALQAHYGLENLWNLDGGIIAWVETQQA